MSPPLRHSDFRTQAAIIDALPANIALLDAQGSIFSVNNAWQLFSDANALQGASAKAGGNYLAICDSAVGEGACEAHEAAAGIRSVLYGEERHFSMEYPCHSPTAQRWFLMTVTPLADDHPNCGVVMHIDITARKLAEQDLLHFRAAMDATADAIFLVRRPSMRFIEVNATACSMLGFSRDELLQMDPMQLGVDPRAEIRQTRELVMAAHDSTLLETRLLRKDGSHLDVEVRLHAQYLGPDWIVVAVVSDITERKRANQALLESERRIYAITANTPGMVFQCMLGTKTGTFCFTYVSEGSTFLLGMEPDAIQADWSAAMKLIAEPDREAFHASLHHSAHSMETWNWEGRTAPLAEVQKWINGRASPRFSDDGDVIWEGVMLNITDSKRGEQSLIQSGQLLRDLSAHTEVTREEERKRIAREVHDELGQSLTALRLDLGLLRLNFGAQNPELVERIRSMIMGVDRTIAIMRHITSMLRPVALDLGLIAGLEWLVDEFSGHSGVRCCLTSKGCDEVVLDDARATALFRIVQESLNNVLRHAEADNVHVAVTLEDDQTVFLEVQDDGKGFIADDGAKPGSFGIIGMRERALMLGGTVNIHSNPGKGTRIEFCIPLIQSEPPPAMRHLMTAP